MPDEASVPALPIPPLAPNVEADVHIAGLREQKLLLPRCDACGTLIWYPRTFCPACSGREVRWVQATGQGVVHSYTVVRRAHGAYAESTPYIVAYVELDEGPRVLTNIVGPATSVRVGDRVSAEFETDADGTPILRFRVDAG